MNKKSLTILTVEIAEDTYHNVKMGTKRFEVSTQPFTGVDIIQYVDSITNKTLGYWRVNSYSSTCANNQTAYTIMSYLSGEKHDVFKVLFPYNETPFFYVAVLGDEIQSIKDIMEDNN